MKLIKKFFKFILASFLIILIFWTIALALLQTKSGQAWATKQLVTYLEQKTDSQIQIGKIGFSFPLALRLENISIAKDQKPLIHIQEMEICCAYTYLLQGKLIFSKVQASHIDIQELPSFSTTSSDSSDASSQPWDAPFIPFYVKLENIDLTHIQFSQSVLNSLHLPKDFRSLTQNSYLNIQGLLSNNPFRQAIAAHLLVKIKQHDNQSTLCSLGIDAQNHYLSLSLHCPQSLLQHLAPNLSSSIKAHLALYASAPLSTWQHIKEGSLEDQTSIQGHFKLSLESLENKNDTLETLLGPYTTLKGHYAIISPLKIDLQEIKIENPSLSLEGNAIFTTAQQIEKAEFKATLDHLERFQQLLGTQLTGYLTFQGSAKGPLSHPLILLEGESPQLSLAQQIFKKVNFKIKTSTEISALQGDVSLNFEHFDQSWNFATFFEWRNQQNLFLNHLKAQALNSQLMGNLHYSFSDNIWNGDLKIRTTDLSDLSYFIDIPIHGEASLDVFLTHVLDQNHQKQQIYQAQIKGQSLAGLDWNAQQLDLQLNIKNLEKKSSFYQIESLLDAKQINWQNYQLEQLHLKSHQQADLTHRSISHLSAEWIAQNIQTATGKVRQMNGQLDLKNPLEQLNGFIDIDMQQIETPEIQLATLKAKSEIHPEQSHWPFELQMKGHWKEDFVVNTEGHWHTQQKDLNLNIRKLNGQFGPYPLQLVHPIELSHHAQQTQLNGLFLRLGEAELQLDLQTDNENFNSHFKTNSIPTELFQYIVTDLPFKGRAIFQGYLEGNLNKPKGQLQIDLDRVQIVEDILVQKPLIAGRINIDLSENRIQLKSELKGVGQTPFLVSGQIPIQFSLMPFHFQIERKQPFNLALDAEGQLDPYLHLFYNNDTTISGKAKIALHLSGQLDSPQIQGNIDLINGSYESLSTGVIYHHIQGRLEGNGSKIVLTHFTAQDNKKGSITATGAVLLDAKQQFPFEFQLNPSHIFILDSDYAKISASGPLSLKGNLKNSKLRGELTADQAVIHLEEALPHQIKNVDVKYINLAEGEKPPTREKKETQSPISLDVKLVVPQLSIQGNNLKSEWKGDIAISGTLQQPQLQGDLRIVQGVYDFNGKKFNFTQGNIHFAGAIDKKTTLYVVASKEIDRIRAEIIVKGAVNHPVISFRSDPPLSQREVLSYILFNRGISNITADQGEQLTQSFISLNSSEQTQSSNDFLSRLRNNIGIDRLDFVTSSDAAENKDFGLQVGKNITENISVTVNQSVSSVAPIIAVEAKLLKNIKAQAEAGVIEDAPVRMSIKWKKDY